MRLLRGILAFSFALLGCAPLFAAEKAAPAVTRGRLTSTTREITHKPLYLFSARGRRDPFLKARDLESGAGNPNDREFSVTELKLVGFLQVDGAPVALLKHRMGSTTYSLRGGKLYSPSNKPMENISGKIEDDRRVLLVQGEKRMHFTSFSSKRP